MRRIVSRHLYLAVMLIAVIAWPDQYTASARPTLTYTLTQEAASDPVWKVVIIGKGYAKPPRLHLDNWGDWRDYEPAARASYLRNLKARPELRDASLPEGTVEFADKAKWNGTFELSYEIPTLRFGSAIQERFPLLPIISGANTSGFAINVFMDVLPGPGVTDVSKVEHTVTVIPPAGATVATGWGGITNGVQQISFSGPILNTAVLIGTPASVKSERRDGIDYEVAQFGVGADHTMEILKTAQSVMPSFEKDSGRKRGRPVRIFQFDTQFNTGLSSAILFANRPRFHTGQQHRVAHELFHDLLGEWIEGNEAIAWFHEGFTDYLSLWYLAATGVIKRDWFALRLADYDAAARSSSAYGKVAFADAGVRWRTEGYETLVYQGGAVIAFLTDVELRKRGQPGLMQLIRDFGHARRKGPVTLHEIAEWMKAHELTEFYQRYYQGRGWPEIDEQLKAIGFVIKEYESESRRAKHYIAAGKELDRFFTFLP